MRERDAKQPDRNPGPARGVFRIPTVWVVMAIVTYAVLHTLYVLSFSD
ncbi:MAG: hypothetical protein ACFBZ8_00315 [Opitutales bacterium]